uniref:Ankyrin repeat and SOCS box protein 6 n=1 Tax=Pyxicephalus adspersus TaxID=30357 RepID=A0AAV3A2T2_PYXAD|nr:TPA: hypothetical protein GDO54_018039 [Pyxicephalus adspersus]
MPFLHGFRRIIFEYQPLADELLGAVGIQDPEQAEVAELGLVPAAEMLLQYGADVCFEDPVTYYTALHIAVLRNQPDMVELLVHNGANIMKRDRRGATERLPCLQRLLDLGADVNSADKNGKTALLHSLASSDGVQIHNTENIRLLLEDVSSGVHRAKGACSSSAVKNGAPGFEAFSRSNPPVEGSPPPVLGETVGSDNEEAKLINHFCFQVSQLLMAHGADPSECLSHESLTHMCLKSFKLHFPLLRFLLESGASYNCSQHGPSCWSGFHILFNRLPWPVDVKVKALPLPDGLKWYLLIHPTTNFEDNL